MGPTESSIVHRNAAPEGVPAALREALAPFSPRWSEHRGDVACLVDRLVWRDAAAAVKAAGYAYLVDHTAVDYPDRRPRFTVVAILMDLDTAHRLILKTRAAEGETVASLARLWASADWAERETYDMFGIPFEGHPDLARIYLPENFEGWPLRRDFPLQGHLRFRD